MPQVISQAKPEALNEGPAQIGDFTFNVLHTQDIHQEVYHLYLMNLQL